VLLREKLGKAISIPEQKRSKKSEKLKQIN
jgi:hypothetical protein